MNAAPPDLIDRIRAIRDALCDNLLEREVPIRLGLLAALAGQHLLLIGPPGTAKSELARRIHLAFDGGAFFERLLTRFTVPEELFGPLSIKQLKEDKYLRLTEAYLPNATVAFLDEIFKANSAILNALLTLLNEGEFDNGTSRLKSPLKSVIGASNELPGESEGQRGPNDATKGKTADLGALYDRFLLRYQLNEIGDEKFEALLQLPDRKFSGLPSGLTGLTTEEVLAVREGAKEVRLPKDVVDLLKELRTALRSQERAMPVSDRRWRKIVNLLKVAAYTNGRSEVSRWDCWLLPFMVSDRPERAHLIEKWYEERVCSGRAAQPEELVRSLLAYEDQLEKDSTNARGSSRVQVAGRLLGVRGLRREVDQHLRRTQAELRGVEGTIRSHLWVRPEFHRKAQRGLRELQGGAEAMLGRADALIFGFEKLPLLPENED